MIATLGKQMTIKDLGTYELLEIDITDDNKKDRISVIICVYELDGTHGCFPIFYRRHPFCFCLYLGW